MEEPKIEEEKTSFLSRLNPFKKRAAKAPAEEQISDDNEFFAALQKSMSTPEETHKIYTQEDYSRVSERSEPRFSAPEPDKVENDPVLSAAPTVEDVSTMPKIIIDEQSRAVPEVKTDDRKGKEQDFAYPFGGWINEDNYKK